VRKRMPVAVGAQTDTPPAEGAQPDTPPADGGVVKSGLAFLRRLKNDDR